MIATLSAFILVLAIPPLIATSPPMPMPLAVRRLTNRPLGKYCLIILLVLLSLVPSPVISVLEDIVLILMLTSTYLLPALLHIVFHHMRRPLSIIVQPHSPRYAADHSATSEHDPDTEELLLRKERALQRRRLGRRIFWDLGVWILLVPVGGGGLGWAVGRLARVW